MSEASEAGEDEIGAAIDSGTHDDAERKDSRLIYQALRDRKDALGAEAAIPAEDKSLTERILTEARTRSAEISATRGGSGHRAQPLSRAIPWWMLLAWLAAIAAVLAGYHYLV